MIQMITYDLNSPGKDYTSLHKAIKDISGVWWHNLTSVWFVDTQLSTAQTTSLLRLYMDQNDELFVIRVTNDYGYKNLAQNVIEWLKNRVY